MPHRYDTPGGQPRRNIKRRLALCAAIGALLASPAASGAQQAPQSGEGASEAAGSEIIVTAQRREQSLKDVPIAITALGSDALESAAIPGTRDLNQIVPGLNMPTGGSFAQPTIRGIGTTATSPGNDANVAVYVDGVYMPNQSANFFMFNSIERIEVLKGPQGTLFGRNATGGAISITTRQPSLTHATGKFLVGYGSFDARQANLYVSTPLSDSTAIDVAGLIDDDSGYLRDALTGERLAVVRNHAIRSKLYSEIGESSRITISGDYSYRSDPQALSARARDRNTAVPGTFIPDDVFETALSFVPTSNIRLGGVSVTGEHDTGSLRFSSISSWRAYRFYNRSDTDKSNFNINSYIYGSRQRTFTQELNVASDLGGPLNFIAGLFFYKDWATVDDVRLSGGPPSLSSVVRTKAGAAYGELTWETGPITLIGGLRYSIERKAFRADNRAGFEYPRDANTYRAWTPRASIVYAVSPDSRVYATYSEGFKSGAFNSQSPTGQAVNPENIRAFELGYKYGSPGFNLSASAFRYAYDDIQIQAVNNQGVATLLNAAKAKIYGAELEASLRLAPAWKLRGGLAYTHGRYNDFPNAPLTFPKNAAQCAPNPAPCGNLAFAGDASGNHMVRTPDFTANFGVDFEDEVGGGTLAASANLYYSSRFFWDVGNRLDQGDYALLNGRLAYRPGNGPLTFAIWGRNLTNTLHSIFSNDSALGDSVVYDRPRTFGITISAEFD